MNHAGCCGGVLLCTRNRGGRWLPSAGWTRSWRALAATLSPITLIAGAGCSFAGRTQSWRTRRRCGRRWCHWTCPVAGAAIYFGTGSYVAGAGCCPWHGPYRVGCWLILADAQWLWVLACRTDSIVAAAEALQQGPVPLDATWRHALL